MHAKCLRRRRVGRGLSTAAIYGRGYRRGTGAVQVKSQRRAGIGQRVVVQRSLSTGSDGVEIGPKASTPSATQTGSCTSTLAMVAQAPLSRQALGCSLCIHMLRCGMDVVMTLWRRLALCCWPFSTYVPTRRSRNADEPKRHAWSWGIMRCIPARITK